MELTFAGVMMLPLDSTVTILVMRTLVATKEVANIQSEGNTCAPVQMGLVDKVASLNTAHVTLAPTTAMSMLTA